MTAADDESARVAKRISELREVEDQQKRIDMVAEDLTSGRHRYALIDAWTLGELLGVHFEDAGDGRWTHLRFGSCVTLSCTRVCSTSGVELSFQGTLSDGYPDGGAWTPYDLAKGEGFDSSGLELQDD